MIRKRILNKWASSSSSRSSSSSSSPSLSPPTTTTSLPSSSSSLPLWKKHSFSSDFVTKNISFTISITVIIIAMIFSIVNIIPHMAHQQQQQQFVSSNNSSYSLMKKKNTHSSNDKDNTTSTSTNSSYYNNNSNIYDQYLEEASSLRCTPLSEIFTDRPSSSNTLLQSLLSYFNLNFNIFNSIIDHPDNNVFKIDDDDWDHYYAVCEFLKNRPNSQHFPHTMQQLYPCVSLWLWNTNKARNQNNHQDKYKIITSNILIIKEHVQDDKNKTSIPIINEFADGFLTALTASSTSSSSSLFNLDLQLVNKIKIVNGKYNRNFNSSNVSVVHVDDYIDEHHMDAMFSSSSSVNNVNSSNDINLPAYTMHHPNDAKMMRQIIFDYYNITTARRGNVNINNNNNNNTTMMTEVELCRLSNKEPSGQEQGQEQGQGQEQDQQQIRTKRRIPVIGFLNRKRSSGRYVTNHVSIVTALEEEFYNTTSANNNVHYLSNFDRFSFVDQITYMNTIDILIGPHGAQFTSIPFLSECSGILELFPIGYYIPTFFGSLSRSTGHYHISYYTGSTSINSTNSTNNNRVRVRIRNEEIRLGHQTLQTRKVSRRKTIIADPNIIIHGVKKLISYWQSCQCMTDVEKDSCTNNW